MNAKSKERHWKEKALLRTVEIRKLRKQIVRLTQSRSRWRENYYRLKRQAKQRFQEKPKGYCYPVALVWLCVYVYHHSVCSLRSLSEMVVAVGLMLQLKLNRPCAATVRIWINKYGYYCYCLKEAEQRKQEEKKAEDRWAVIVDESVAVGQERLLVVLGVPLQQAPLPSALTHKDVKVLFLSVAASWKGTQIAEKLKAVAERLKVVYCVSDKGNNIMAAVRELRWYHVYDCTHLWAGAMEQVYKKQKDFEALIRELTALRKRWILSRYAPLLPPAPRSKARFLNCFVQVAWMEKVKQCLHTLDEKATAALGFLNTYASLIEELSVLKKVVEQMALLLKAKGLNRQNLAQCFLIMEPLQKGRPLAFKQKVLAEWQNHEQKLTAGETLLCCSDIIESCFGRLKLQLKVNSTQALTESVLSLCGYADSVSRQDVKEALNKVHMQDIEAWKKQNTIPSLQQKRREFFNKNRPKLKTAA